MGAEWERNGSGEREPSQQVALRTPNPNLTYPGIMLEKAVVNINGTL